MQNTLMKDKHISKLLQADELNSNNAQQLNVEELEIIPSTNSGDKAMLLPKV